MKPIELSVQEEPNFCLCSALQAILRGYNINMTQQEIADNLTQTSGLFHAYDEKIKIFMQKTGFDYHAVLLRKVTQKDAYIQLREMDRNHGIIGIDGHAYLLIGIKSDTLELIDPKNGKKVRKKYENIMKKKRGIFCLIKPLQ